MVRSVLLIDDDRDDWDILQESLFQVNFHYEFHAVASAEEAFEFLKNNKENSPSLIILDLVMPRTNGIDILKRLAKEYAIPVIVHTTVCTDEIIRSAKEFGAIDCVKKGTRYSDNLKFAQRICDLMKGMETAA